MNEERVEADMVGRFVRSVTYASDRFRGQPLSPASVQQMLDALDAARDVIKPCCEGTRIRDTQMTFYAEFNHE